MQAGSWGWHLLGGMGGGGGGDRAWGRDSRLRRQLRGWGQSLESGGQIGAGSCRGGVGGSTVMGGRRLEIPAPLESW